MDADKRARVFIGWGPDRDWLWSDPEQCVLVLGPPRKGKTTCLVVPTVLSAPGAVVVTSTKPDVAKHTLSRRRAAGTVWHFSPSGSADAPPGAQPVHWSPIAAAKSWDGSLLVTRAMTAASPTAHVGESDSFWSERASALLAPLLHAAALDARGIDEVLTWLLQWDLEPAADILENHRADWAANVLLSVAKSADRERSSVFSTASNVLSAYFADAARSVADPSRIAACAFDPEAFVRSKDTLYITAPAHKQSLSAPLIIGLLEEIRHAAYRRARAVVLGAEPEGSDCLFALDECANVAPIHDLGALVSESGGQGLVVLAVLQDLSQARSRWGSDAGNGFLSVFGVKLVLPGIADRSTLESLSIALGEHTEWVPSVSESATAAGPVGSRGGSWSYRPNFSPGEIAGLKRHHALHVTGSEATVVKLVPWEETPVGREPGSPVAAGGRRVTSRVRRRSS